MTLIFKPFQSQLENKDGEKTWHPTLVKPSQVITTQDLAVKLSEYSTLTPGDVHGVLRNLPWAMKSELLNGNTIKIEGLGTFTFVSRSGGRGVLTPEEVNAGQIKLHCQFTPEYTKDTQGTRATTILQGAKFMSLSNFLGLKEDSNSTGGGNSGNGDDDDYVDPNA